jgi:NADH/NAD ratio-sensing transcriptional regulator Rex
MTTTVNIDNKTRIPLFAVLTALPILLGFMVWITGVAADAKKGANSADLIEQIHLDVAEIKQDIKYLKEARR